MQLFTEIIFISSPCQPQSYLSALEVGSVYSIVEACSVCAEFGESVYNDSYSCHQCLIYNSHMMTAWTSGRCQNMQNMPKGLYLITDRHVVFGDTLDITTIHAAVTLATATEWLAGFGIPETVMYRCPYYRRMYAFTTTRQYMDVIVFVECTHRCSINQPVWTL
jgi:hypothetical protein